jgi:hypothetical protein
VLFDVSSTHAFSPYKSYEVNSSFQPSLTPTLTFEERLEKVESEVEDIKEQIKVTQKDNWDKLDAASGTFEVVGTLLIAFIGGLAALIYREKQQKLLNVQTVQGFMQYLQTGDERAVHAALLAISELGNTKIAAGFAEYFQSDGAITAMAKIASTQIGEKANQAKIALNKAVVDFQPMVNSLVEIWDADRLRGIGLLVDTTGTIVTTDYITDTLDISKRKVIADGKELALVRPEVETLEYGLARFQILESRHLQPYTNWKPNGSNSVEVEQWVYILGAQPRAGMIPVTGRVVETSRVFLGVEDMIVLSIQSFNFSREFYGGAMVLGLNYELIGIVVHVNTSIRYNSIEEVTVLRKEHIYQALPSEDNQESTFL